ncbi:MAG: endolytic transglycosylase MltG [Eubacteriales bacterium]|nr:endolytic transglycosylase MltG [Eubacteriales bacterium]MDD4323979.1 endolytic transglycosylase MltG [Eubacteriales bacterium]MDD4541328.1 endolytic transglycosylase MltG [Eubacteriales bacterium]
MPRKVRKILTFLGIIVILIVAVLVGFFLGFRYVSEQDQRLDELSELIEREGISPITADTEGAVEIYIAQQSNTEDIAATLEEAGLINNTFAYELISKFNGFDGQYQYGTHYLLPDMTYDEMMLVLTRQPKQISITFYEGMTYEQMRDKMLEAGMRFNPDLLDAMVNRPSLFTDYSFISGIEERPGREWLLQGYLWPDTYLFDINATEQQILRIFLNNTEAKFAEGDYIKRAERQGITLDDAIILASIIQDEGTISEMNKIGRVFINRLAIEMPLESCATVNYLRESDGKEPKLWMSNNDLREYASNPYNSYYFDGLPPGPINSPGVVAIEGVLWPATERTWPGADSYLFFTATGEGTNDFSVTYEEHAAKTARYVAAYEG